jgi:hypothetical protein
MRGSALKNSCLAAGLIAMLTTAAAAEGLTDDYSGLAAATAEQIAAQKRLAAKGARDAREAASAPARLFPMNIVRGKSFDEAALRVPGLAGFIKVGAPRQGWSSLAVAAVLDPSIAVDDGRVIPFLLLDNADVQEDALISERLATLDRMGVKVFFVLHPK